MRGPRRRVRSGSLGGRCANRAGRPRHSGRRRNRPCGRLRADGPLMICLAARSGTAPSERLWPPRCARGGRSGDDDQQFVADREAADLPLVGDAPGRGGDVLGCVLATISTTICEPRFCLMAVSLSASACRCAAESVSSGRSRGRTAAAPAARPRERGGASAPSTSAARKPQAQHGVGLLTSRPALSKLTAGGCEICASFCTAKFSSPVAEQHRGEVGREAAREHVCVLHRLDVAAARHGDAVLGASSCTRRSRKPWLAFRFG